MENPDPKLPDRKWTVLKRKYLFQVSWLTVRCDTVQLPTRSIIPDYYVLEYPTWVNVIAITPDGQYVMVRQYRHGLQYTGYELCAGVCETGETPLEAIKRELYEETGYGEGHWELCSVLSGNTSTTTNLTYSFIAKDVIKISGQHLEKTEDLSVHLLPRDEVLRLVMQDEIKQSLMTAPLLKHFLTERNKEEKQP